MVGFVGLGPACSPPNIAGEPLKGPTTGEAFAGVQCSAVRPQTEPDLMAWDSGSRSNLNRLRRKGVVAVRYEAKGCNVELELLSNCIAPGATYEFSPYSANEHKLARNANELFAQLPVGAARLSGSLKGDRVLRTDYMLAGQYALPPGTTLRASELKGDCARATHAVSAVYVGAFAMGAGESRVMEGGVSLLGAGGGLKSSAAVESLGDEGSAEACKVSQEAAKENERCSVPLRIGLIALEGRAEAPPAPAAVARAESPRPVVAPAYVAPSPSPVGGAESGAMVSVPAGSFMMGSNDGEACEKPVHRVSVVGFAMDVTEVTTAAYTACVRAGRCSAANTGESCNYGHSDKNNHPINCVDWDQATAYCGSVGKRLPTEEEWEYAARGTDGRKYPWGNEEPGTRACWNEGWAGSTCSVGSYASGVFGLKDMAGNVWEWTASGYSSDYSNSRASAARVVRGGRWYDTVASLLRSSGRSRNAPSDRYDIIGFRCAR
jgi:formylglycine-generating enzyme required for sulfatase activity